MMNDKDKKNNLINPEEWDRVYENLPLVKDDGSQRNPVRDLIIKFIDKSAGDCLEVGCFPGRFITIFGDLGYTLHGVDITKRVEDDLPGWLKILGYRIGKFEQMDFIDFNPGRKYDIVCSFGFIEHFTDWESVLKKHIDLVEDGGYLIITTPNFLGYVQKILHEYLDRENFKKHNVTSMDSSKWATIAREKNFTILFSGYYGGFDFWDDNKRKNFFQKIFIKILYTLSRYGHDLPCSRFYSPYSVLVAKKNVHKAA